MEGLVEEGLVEEPQSFAQNRLAVIVPGENPADIQSHEDLAREDISLVLALEEVPVAEYTEESLQMANEVYGEGFEDEVLSNLVSREQDVRAAANRVALGEADATFVYTSDITPDIEDRVQVIEVPEEVNVVAAYPIAVVEDSQNSELARVWVDLVLSEEGQGVLEKWGFQRAA
jgi:molybdate transport system substrate-binding protein